MKVYQIHRDEQVVAPAPPSAAHSDLNPAQREAVEVEEGPCLVIAGAGSGKTRTLVHRVARLVEKGIDPGQIVLLTFTRRAADEMLRRASGLLDHRCERVGGGTFHSFAHALLRKYARAIGLPNSFSVMDRSDSEDLIQHLRTRLRLDARKRRFPHKGTLASVYSKAINKAQSIPDVVAAEVPQFLDDLPDILALWEAYVKHKEENAVLDYDDLLTRLRRLLAENEPIRRKISQEHRFILVDEYQDTNRLQADLLVLLTETHKNIMVVGDDAQSIYAFRGANFRNIMDFPSLFPGCRIIRLEENYRSVQPVLDLANAIHASAKEKYPKNLFTKKEGGPKPVLIVCPDERAQSEFVAQRVLELREEGVSLEDIAVLFRASHHSFDLEAELARRNIPFVKYGGFKFMETAHIKDVIAHLRVLVNPLDGVSWQRLLLLVPKVGPKTAQEIIAHLRSSQNGVEAMSQLPRFKALSGLKALADTLRDVRANRDVAGQIERLLKYYKPILEDRYKDDFPHRWRDLEHLKLLAQGYGSTESFLSDLALDQPDSSVAGVEAAEEEEEPLVLSTIHSAKGLEWHTVFLIWALDGYFPSDYAFRSEEQLEEERRLLYVAVTRAKENVHISYPTNAYLSGAGSVLTEPCRFLDGIGEDLLERWAVKGSNR